MIVQIISSVFTSRAFELQALALQRGGYEQHYILLNTGPSDFETFLRENNVPVMRITLAGKKTWPLILVLLVAKLRQLNPSMIHCHLHDATILGLLAAYVLGIRSRVFTRHHGNVFRKGYRAYSRKGIIWDLIANRLATKIVAVSDVVKRILVTHEKVDSGKISVIRFSFNMDEFDLMDEDAVQFMREKYGLVCFRPIIGAVSRLDDWKGLRYTIEAFSQLRQDYPSAVLVIANARGAQADELTHLLRELPKASWRLIPFEQNIAALFKCFDIFVHVPIDGDVEAFGQVYVEALASGVPSIFTLSGIAHEFAKHRVNCWLVPYKASQAIYEGMKALLADQRLREEIRAGGRKIVHARFSIEAQKNDLLSFYAKKQ